MIFKKVSAHDFLAFPSPTKLIQMGTHRAEDIIEELGEGITDIDQIVKVFLKVSSVVVLNDKETREAACSCSEELLKQAFNSCLANISSLLPNSLLVHLGLLKGEDKRYKPPGDISGPLLVLAHIVKQPYFPDFSRDILTSFVSRPSKLTETCHEAKEVFLQAACS